MRTQLRSQQSSHIVTRILLQRPWLFFPALAFLVVSGCQSGPKQTAEAPAVSAQTPAPSAAPPSQPASAAPAPAAAAPVAARTPIRIKAGGSSGFTDSDGNAWLPDQGFEGGETADRPDLQIANTKDPAIYRAERYSMESFSRKLSNGKYVVKLHFAETFDGIEGPGQRVFSFKVGDQEFKDFDVWAKAGGFCRAYVETVNVEVTNGKLDIVFTSKVENPEINGIEILPVD